MLILSLSGCLADLRPEEIDPSSAQEDRASAGRARLEAAAAASGLDAWLRMDRAELAFRDVWVGPARLFNPWPGPDVTVDLVQRPGTFDSTAKFRDGPRAGWTWAIADGEPWQIDPEGQRQQVDDDDVRFMLPTVQYFVDLPFRLLEAPIVREVGDVAIDGRAFDVVYVTWESVAANPDYDQYLVFVGRETGRIEKLRYTVREMTGWIEGTCHLDDPREIDGIWVPHRMTVNGAPTDPPEEGLAHTMTIASIAYTDEDGLARAAGSAKLPADPTETR